MTLYLKDGVEQVVLFSARPADVQAITATAITGQWTTAIDLSGSIVKPLNINASSSDTFAFNTIDISGNGNGVGKSNAAGTLRIKREYDSTDSQPHAAGDSVFEALRVKNTLVRLGVYRGPKASNAAKVAGDEVEYYEFYTDTPRVIEEDNMYICFDVPLVFAGKSSEGIFPLVA